MTASDDFQELARLNSGSEEDLMIVRQALHATAPDGNNTSATSSSDDWFTIASILGVEVERLTVVNQHQVNILHRAGLYPIKPSPPAFDVEPLEQAESEISPMTELIIDRFAHLIYNQNPALQPWNGDPYSYEEEGAGHQKRLARKQAEEIVNYLTQGAKEHGLV